MTFNNKTESDDEKGVKFLNIVLDVLLNRRRT